MLLPEILYEIFALIHLNWDKSTLKRCRLVCKEWCYQSTSKLFDVFVVIQHWSNHKKFNAVASAIRLLHSQPPIRNAVRTLIVTNTFSAGGRFPVSAPKRWEMTKPILTISVLEHLLVILPNLCNLDISRAEIAPENYGTGLNPLVDGLRRFVESLSAPLLSPRTPIALDRLSVPWVVSNAISMTKLLRSFSRAATFEVYAPHYIVLTDDWNYPDVGTYTRIPPSLIQVDTLQFRHMNSHLIDTFRPSVDFQHICSLTVEHTLRTNAFFNAQDMLLINFGDIASACTGLQEFSIDICTLFKRFYEISKYLLYCFSVELY